MSTFEELRAAIIREDGVKVSRLLSVLNGDPEHWAAIAYSTNAAMADTDIRSRFAEPLWGNVAYTYWEYAVGLMKNHSLVDAYTLQNEILQYLNRIAERSDNWILPVLSSTAQQLRKVAFLASST